MQEQQTLEDGHEITLDRHRFLPDLPRLLWARCDDRAAQPIMGGRPFPFAGLRGLVVRGSLAAGRGILRHPIYVFGTMAFLFVVLALQGWPGLIIWAAVILIQVVRLRREEQVLAERFGAEYAAYRSTTWF